MQYPMSEQTQNNNGRSVTQRRSNNGRMSMFIRRLTVPVCRFSFAYPWIYFALLR